jgi:hypothetical protein
MDKINVAALVVAVGASIGGILTAILNYLHGRDDANGLDKFVTALEEQTRQQASHTAEVTNMLNDQFNRTSQLLERLVMRRR